MQKIVTLFVLTTVLMAQCPDNDKYCAQCITVTSTTTVVGANGNNTANATSSSCRICHGAFLASSGVCNPPANRYSNCVRYDNSSNCLGCDYNYYLSATNQCSKNPDSKCATYNTTSGCTACNGGKLVKNGSCDNNNDSCGVENCDICNAANQCERCVYGHVLRIDQNFTCASYGNNNVANANNPNITNYIPYTNCLNSVGGICTECRFGYYSTNGGCSQTDVIQGGLSSASLIGAGLIALLSALIA